MHLPVIGTHDELQLHVIQSHAPDGCAAIHPSVQQRDAVDSDGGSASSAARADLHDCAEPGRQHRYRRRPECDADRNPGRRPVWNLRDQQLQRQPDAHRDDRILSRGGSVPTCKQTNRFSGHRYALRKGSLRIAGKHRTGHAGRPSCGWQRCATNANMPFNSIFMLLNGRRVTEMLSYLLCAAGL